MFSIVGKKKFKFSVVGFVGNKKFIILNFWQLDLSKMCHVNFFLILTN